MIVYFHIWFGYNISMTTYKDDICPPPQYSRNFKRLREFEENLSQLWIARRKTFAWISSKNSASGRIRIRNNLYQLWKTIRMSYLGNSFAGPPACTCHHGNFAHLKYRSNNCKEQRYWTDTMGYRIWRYHHAASGSLSSLEERKMTKYE